MAELSMFNKDVFRTIKGALSRVPILVLELPCYYDISFKGEFSK